MADKKPNPFLRLSNEKDMKKKKETIALVIAGVVLFVAALVVMITIPISTRNRYITYIKNLSTDTTYAERNNTATCTLDGETYSISGEEVFELYRCISYRDDIDYYKKAEEPQPGIHIDYGNGSTLDIWLKPYEKDGTQYTTGIGVLYINSNGKKYTYTTENIKYNSLLNCVKH
ncbi:MAG: hypothetical protein IKR67_04600 [Lachnospiraceae bacterium]|nr:hypothetical protein [Lachnospiraceae bacterium]